MYVGNLQQSVRIAHNCATDGQPVQDMKYTGEHGNSLDPGIDINANSTYELHLHITKLHASTQHYSQTLKHDSENSKLVGPASNEDILMVDELINATDNSDLDGTGGDSIFASGDGIAIPESPDDIQGTEKPRSQTPGMDDMMMHDQYRLEAKGSPIDNKIDLVSSMSDKGSEYIKGNITHDSAAEPNHIEMPNEVVGRFYDDDDNIDGKASSKITTTETVTSSATTKTPSIQGTTSDGTSATSDMPRMTNHTTEVPLVNGTVERNVTSTSDGSADPSDVPLPEETATYPMIQGIDEQYITDVTLEDVSKNGTTLSATSPTPLTSQAVTDSYANATYPTLTGICFCFPFSQTFVTRT